MLFMNNTVEMEAIPRAEDVELKPIDNDYLKVIRIDWAIFSLVFLAILTFLVLLISELRQPVWLAVIGGGWLLLVSLFFLVQTRSFHRKAFALREKDIIYRSGWIVQRTHICPFNRIQHSSVSTGPIERRYKLGTLLLYTAGATGSDLRIPGLKEEEARAIKEWITKKIANERHAN